MPPLGLASAQVQADPRDLLLTGTAQSGFDREMGKMRPQVQMACLRGLMNEGHQLMYEADRMTTYCRQFASRRIRLATAGQAGYPWAMRD